MGWFSGEHHPTGLHQTVERETITFRVWHHLNRPHPQPQHLANPHMETPLLEGSSGAGQASRKPLHPEHPEHGTVSIYRLPGINIQPPHVWNPLYACKARSSPRFTGAHHLTSLRETLERAESRYIQSMASHQPTASPSSTPNHLTNGNP